MHGLLPVFGVRVHALLSVCFHFLAAAVLCASFLTIPVLFVTILAPILLAIFPHSDSCHPTSFHFPSLHLLLWLLDVVMYHLCFLLPMLPSWNCGQSVLVTDMNTHSHLLTKIWQETYLPSLLLSSVSLVL